MGQSRPLSRRCRIQSPHEVTSSSMLREYSNSSSNFNKCSCSMAPQLKSNRKVIVSCDGRAILCKRTRANLLLTLAEYISTSKGKNYCVEHQPRYGWYNRRRHLLTGDMTDMKFLTLDSSELPQPKMNLCHHWPETALR